MSEYTPDNWVVLKIKPGKGAYPLYKVLAGWSGGYLGADSWRMNSGITGCHMEKDGDYYFFTGHSGSVYRCHKKGYGLRMNNAGVYNKIKENQQFDGQVILMDENTDWLNVKW